MSRTIAAKVLGEKAGKTDAVPGEILEAEVDYIMLNDVTGLPAFEVFREFGVEPLKEKTILIPDHYVPSKDVPSAEQARAMHLFARKYNMPHYFPVGTCGVCHQVMIEEGFVAPGRLIIGADSHTCSYGAFGAFGTGVGSTEAASAMARGKLWFKVPESQKITVNGRLNSYVMGKDIILHIIGDIGVDGALYKSMEFYGETIDSLSLADRISISNMVIEAGGKAGIIPPDQKVFDYLLGKVKGSYEAVYSDKDAEYVESYEYDASEIPPTVAKPSLPENTSPASELSSITVDQAYLGSCTNGRIEDLRTASKILVGRKVNADTRMIVVPASKRVYEQALEEGLLKIFLNANAYVSGPTCGACLGGYMGVLAKGERCISSTNRNFVGRMGHKDSEVYLANPAVVAASAVKGRITDPSELK
jgi:3-isopropylmalate/(R)-2-methylmalate dehydratase large subunit